MRKSQIFCPGGEEEAICAEFQKSTFEPAAAPYGALRDLYTPSSVNPFFLDRLTAPLHG